MPRIGRLLPFSPSTTPLQAATYLLGISLFSISFLVFLNSAVSFLITDLLNIKHNVGDIVGTLGFVDELVALVACPIWGLVSDRLGVRWVAVLGYAVIGLSLFCFVQVGQGWEGVRGLVVVRILFAVGATAAATMVTAILPSLTDDNAGEPDEDEERTPRRSRKPSSSNRNSLAMSLESDMTITPERYRGLSADGSSGRSNDGEEHSTRDDGKGKKPSALAGFVGLFTGCGALVALSLFLPLPAQFSKREGVTPAQAITYSFYIVGVVAFFVAVFVFFGLRGLKGEEGKGWRMLLGSRSKEANSSGEDNTSLPPGSKAYKPLAYRHLLLSSLRLGLTDSHIAIGYLGGFVARASTVAISLFIPLYINTFFISNGFCQGSPHDPSPELKKECRAAYILSSILSGVAQLIALMCAPLFGYLSARRWRGVNLPILVSTLCGVVGYIAFPQLQSPEYEDIDGRGGSGVVFLIVALLGISQIGAIVCSLGSLGRGVLSADLPTSSSTTADENCGEAESEPLLEGEHNSRVEDEKLVSRVQLKGSVAGVYSWCGGAAILLLTKLGGYLFDVASNGAPFYMMAAFNAILLVAVLAIDLGKESEAYLSLLLTIGAITPTSCFHLSQSADKEVFKAVAGHETLRHQVTEIIWDDATLWGGPRKPREDEEDYYPGDDDYDSEEEESCDDDSQDNVDLSAQVPSWYLKTYKRNIALFHQAKSDDTERPDHVARAKQMSSLMPASEAWAYYAELLEQQRKILDSGAHSCAFVEHINSFPALRRVTITPATYGRLFNPLYDTPMIRAFPRGFNCPLSRGWPCEDLRIPEVPPWKNEGSDWQGFRVVTRALAENREHGKVTDLRIDASHVETGLNIMVFDNESNNAFGNFEKLLARPNFRHLHLDLLVQDYSRQAEVFHHGLLKRALQNAADGQGLEHLHIGTNIDIPGSLRRAEFYVTLDTIFEPTSLSRLQHFGLSRFYVKESDLLGLLALLPHTLRTVELDLLDFLDHEGSFQTFLTKVRDTLGWADRTPRPTMRISVQTATMDDFRQVWVEDDVSRFLYLGGSNPFGDDPAEPYPNTIKMGFGRIRDAFEPQYERPHTDRQELRQLGYIKPFVES